jgi:hypothetical protein
LGGLAVASVTREDVERFLHDVAEGGQDPSERVLQPLAALPASFAQNASPRHGLS